MEDGEIDAAKLSGVRFLRNGAENGVSCPISLSGGCSQKNPRE